MRVKTHDHVQEVDRVGAELGNVHVRLNNAALGLEYLLLLRKAQL